MRLPWRRLWRIHTRTRPHPQPFSPNTHTHTVLAAGTVAMHSHLLSGAKGLYAGGKAGIFTPMLYFRARKPGSGAATGALPADSGHSVPAPSGGGGRGGSKGPRKRGGSS